MYLGESYIHHADHRKDRPNKRTGNLRSGRRWCCFALAIQGPDPRVPPSTRSLEDSAGVVDESLWVFSPGAGKAKEQRDTAKALAHASGTPAEASSTKLPRCCGICKQPGHNRRSCPGKGAQSPSTKRASTQGARGGYDDTKDVDPSAHYGDYHKSFTGW